jgi:uncharacterized membrane protein HdeD (DUF308 family)
MASKQSIRRRLWNAPPTAGFWVCGVALVVACVGGFVSPGLSTVLIVLGIVLGLAGIILITTNRDHKPESLYEFHPDRPRDGS